MTTTLPEGAVEHIAVDIPDSVRTTSEIAKGIQIADDFDRELLQRAVHDAGRWAYGICMVELWVMNEQKTKLCRPPVAHWIDPVRHKSVCTGHCDLCRLTEPDHPDYLPPDPLAPGVGLPGILWNESLASNQSRRRINAFAELREMAAPSNRRVVWRNVASLVEDPNQTYSERLIGLYEAGLGWAAGIRFVNGAEQGIVIFLSSRACHGIRSTMNESYLLAAADLIGSAWALRGPRHLMVEHHDAQLGRTLRRARHKLLALIRVGVTVEQLAQPPKKTTTTAASSAMEAAMSSDSIIGRTAKYSKHKLAQLFDKSIHGGRSQAPPGKTLYESFYSGVGTFLTMMIVTQFGLAFVEAGGSSLVVGPFGALATLHYSLTAAPAAQPINSFFGQVVGLILGVLFSLTSLEGWMRMSLAPALTVLITTKFGIVHPPAGASAVIFAGSSTLSWGNMGVFLLAYAIVIVCSTLVNNWNDKRQYPTYWGVGFLWDAIARPKDDEMKME